MESAIEAIPYSWQSILPSLIAISAAFLTRQVFFSLFAGIWVGAFLMEGASVSAIADGLLRVMDTYLLRALVPADGSLDHMSVVLFTLTVGGTIGIISANGGMRGVVRWLTKFANTPAKGQGATFGMGFVIFFDDYANTLIVGKTLRPLTDRLGISREKLAFLVDATAAPLACIALVTTWIGFQLSLLDASLKTLPQLEMSAYEIFLSSLSYSFYPILMLLFIVMIILTGRDFGPMLKAEQTAREAFLTESKAALSTDTSNAINAAFPILVLIITTICGLFATGDGESIREILGDANPFKAMLWGSLASLLAAIFITMIRRSLKIEEIMSAMEDGFKPMLTAVMILTFAWAIADINSELRLAHYIVSQIGDSLSPGLLPAIIFITAAITAFATGSSWGTMGILVPLVLPLTVSALESTQSFDPDHFHIIYAATASIMAGAVWGDHCSPISDTTILSSLASDCPHMNHVQTQMPYALSVAAIALLIGILPASYGVPGYLLFPIGIVALWFILRQFGKQAA